MLTAFVGRQRPSAITVWSVSMTKESILRSDLNRYLSEKTVTAEKYQELCNWVASGNSVYANPWYMAGEDGGELDFLTVKQVMLELLAEK